MKKDKRPLYVDVYNKIYDNIIKKELKPGDKIPSELELSKLYNVGRGTVRQALLLLKENGIIYNVHGSGSYVAESVNKSFNARLEKMMSIPLNFSKKPLKDELYSMVYDLPNNYFINKTNIKPDELVVDLHKKYIQNDRLVVAYTLTTVSVDILKTLNVDISDREMLSNFIDHNIYQHATSIITKLIISEAGEFLTKLFNVKSKTIVLIIEEEFHNSKGETFLMKRHSLLPDSFDLQIHRK